MGHCADQVVALVHPVKPDGFPVRHQDNRVVAARRRCHKAPASKGFRRNPGPHPRQMRNSPPALCNPGVAMPTASGGARVGPAAPRRSVTHTDRRRQPVGVRRPTSAATTRRPQPASAGPLWGVHLQGKRDQRIIPYHIDTPPREWERSIPAVVVILLCVVSDLRTCPNFLESPSLLITIR